MWSLYNTFTMNTKIPFVQSFKSKVASFFTRKNVKENIKFIGILLLVYIVITLALRFLPFLQVYNTYTIRTDSMEPVLMVGDVIVVEDIATEDIEVGNIVAFYVDVTNDGVDDVIIHYIDEIIQLDEETLVFKSKPEVSNLQDRWVIEEQDIIGVYKYQVENIGKILLFLNSWIGRIVLLVDIFLVWFIVDVLFPKKNKKKSTLSNDVNEEEPKEETQP